MKITKRQLRRIIREAGAPQAVPATLVQQAYEEGFEQGRHDAIEQMGEGEVMRHMFDSQEEYDAFINGYEDGYYG
tara:strand:- start:3572 stop:3796 length:225 start_codon:yes stop_codon:yes gene_type:complete